LKRAHLNDKDSNILGIWLTPGDIEAVSVRHDVANFIKHVEYWKQGIFGIISKHALGDLADELLDEKIMSRIASDVSSFIPLLTAKLSGSGHQTARTKDVIDNFIKSGILNVYIDDIDRGWSASKADIKNISALLNAIRDISGRDRRIHFCIGLRSDVYFLVRTSDESTDKIENNVIWLHGITMIFRP
jgi:hypothetical protein